MAYRPGGMSDSSEDEFDEYIYNDSTALSTKKIDNNNCNEHHDKIEDQNDEQDRQFRVLTACMTGQIATIDEYLNLGRDVNAFFYTGWTMLLYASSAALPEVVEHLLKFGADPNQHKDGYTPLMAICESSKGTTEQCLKCLRLLLLAKADPDAVNKDRRVPLMCACKSRKVEFVEELLKYVRNIEATDCDGRTAIFYAVTGNNPEIVKLLIKHKASTTIIDRRHLSLKDIALAKNNDKILQILNFDHDDIEDYCPITKVLNWQDTIANTNILDLNCVDEDIANILYALGLDKYRRNFVGMNLKKFLKLTEDDLINLGVDIQYHRKQFITGLLKFHLGKWNPKSIKIVDKSTPYKIFDGVVSFANIVRQIGVISSSLEYITNHLMRNDENKIILDNNERDAFKKSLGETETILASLQKDFEQILSFAQQIEKTNRGVTEPAYIGTNECNKKKARWMIILSITLMTGMFLSKTSYVQKLWN